MRPDSLKSPSVHRHKPHPHTPVQRAVQTRMGSLGGLAYWWEIWLKVYTSVVCSGRLVVFGGYMGVGYGVESKIVRRDMLLRGCFVGVWWWMGGW